MKTVQLKSIGKSCNFPTNWDEVSVAQFIELQRIEDELLPLLAKMNALKAEDDGLAAEVEALYFSKASNPLAEIGILSHNNRRDAILADYNAIKIRYDKLDARRCMALAKLAESDFYSITDAEVAYLRSLSFLLFSQEFVAQQPEIESEGVWIVRCPRVAGQQAVKVRYYLRHLADYPACIHQVYHAMLKSIRNLTEKAVAERTDAEIELAALFVLPKADEILYAIFGGKPEKIDFDSGTFSERLQQYWNVRQTEMQMIPITALKGVVGFFLPHWENYFKNKAPMQAMPTSTGTEIY